MEPAETAVHSENIASCLRHIAAFKGNATGLIEAKTGRKLTFGELDRHSDQYAWYLSKQNVTPGDRVMLMVKPSAEFICITFALFKLGAVVILIDPGMGYKNLLGCIANVQPRVLIGIFQAQVFARIFPKHFATLQLRICCGGFCTIFGKDFTKVPHPEDTFPLYKPAKDDLAAIIFTTGSTGPPKGVRYEHSIFKAQLQHIREYYAITDKDIDQPAFPLFALFSTALGACAVIPDMDATKPAKVDPRKFIESLTAHGVTYSFGSPALWKAVSRYCHTNNIKIAGLKKVLMAGAPVSGELIEDMASVLPDDAQIHTPYGATESLPIVSIESREIRNQTWAMTRAGKGTCVGRPLPGIDIAVIAIHDKTVEQLSADMFVGPGEIGEILVSGNVVTRSYDNNDEETRRSKTYYDNKLWHRMGDTGYLDESGRLWFCGRKAHRVVTPYGTKYTIQCEAIINNHSNIFRSALVGIYDDGNFQVPAIVLELEKKCRRPKNEVLAEVKALALASPLTADIGHYYFHPGFPVDIRHNAKIFREKLAVWVEKQAVKNPKVHQ